MKMKLNLWKKKSKTTTIDQPKKFEDPLTAQPKKFEDPLTAQPKKFEDPLTAQPEVTKTAAKPLKQERTLASTKKASSSPPADE